VFIHARLLLAFAAFTLHRLCPIDSAHYFVGSEHDRHKKSGNVYDITGGTRPGNGTNLFHSFGEFGVPTNHVANFLNDSGLATSNILGRVTGGNPSNILGAIQTTGFGSGNLFVMNPAGVVFGANASLNVGGSASFTTADFFGSQMGLGSMRYRDRLMLRSRAPPSLRIGFWGRTRGPLQCRGANSRSQVKKVSHSS
jgi:filamentous hemagglutinin family protein